MIVDNTKPLQEYGPAMNLLMRAVAKRMSDDPEKWLTRVWISDGSSVYDFGLSDVDMEEIESEVGVQFPRGYNLFEIADRIQELPQMQLNFGM
jgi:hypothetical protein